LCIYFVVNGKRLYIRIRYTRAWYYIINIILLYYTRYTARVADRRQRKRTPHARESSAGDRRVVKSGSAEAAAHVKRRRSNACRVINIIHIILYIMYIYTGWFTASMLTPIYFPFSIQTINILNLLLLYIYIYIFVIICTYVFISNK